jgi:hypothetical protein
MPMVAQLLRCGKVRADARNGTGSGDFAARTHLVCSGVARKRGRTHEYENECDEAERRDGHGVAEHALPER